MFRWLRWIRDDTRALIADIRRLLGRLSTRWQWFRLRSRRRLDSTAADLENVRRSAESRTRMCRECRALIPISAKVCPECGERPGGAVARGVSRVVSNMMPGFASVSSVLLTANMILYVSSNLVWAQLSGGGLPPDVRASAWNVALLALGANNSYFLMDGEYWRLVTSVFLHGGLLHLLFNCYALMMLAPFIEHLYGPRRFAVLYLVSGVAGMIASAWWNFPVGVGIGASGAIFGLIGVGVVWGWRRGDAAGQGIKGQLMQWALYGLVMGFMFRFDNAAHIGGLLAGAAMALVVSDSEPRSPAVSRLWEAAAWLAALAVVGSFALVALKYQSTLHEVLGGG